MTATISLLLGLGFGRTAVVVDLVLTGVILAVGAVVMTRAGRVQAKGTPPAGLHAGSGVVAEAEAVVADADHQPV